MVSTADTPEAYLDELTGDRKQVLCQLHQVILHHLSEGFISTMSYGMIGYVVPHEVYPAGYHCNPLLPLPFAAIASQKNFVALYHMGLYADPLLYDWFTSAYSKQYKYKLNVGKSCIRFKKPEQIPMELIGELMQKLTVQNWINLYEHHYKK